MCFDLSASCSYTRTDDNGNLNDGTPHMRAIYNAFNEHEIACNTLTAQDSGCSGTPNVAPLVTVTPGNMRAVISWTAVSGASNYQVFRSEGDVKKCNQGKVKLTTTTSLSFTDAGLMNGRDYYYIVIPKGPNDSCFGPSSSCMMVEPTSPTPNQSPNQSGGRCQIWKENKYKVEVSFPTCGPDVTLEWDCRKNRRDNLYFWGIEWPNRNVAIHEKRLKTNDLKPNRNTWGRCKYTMRDLKCNTAYSVKITRHRFNQQKPFVSC